MSAKSTLETLRARIDKIDNELLRLINERVRLAAKVGTDKAIREESVYRPEREAQIIDRLVQENPGPLSAEVTSFIFREIISLARCAETQITIAALGPSGTFSEQAAYRLFGHQISLVEAISIEDVFRLAEAGEALYGVVPVENSTEGGVNSTLDLLLDTPLVISNEVELKIVHCLLAQPGAGPPAQIAAHQQALAQCRQWLAAHYPGVPLVAKASNADAARSAGADKTTYAVASATTAPIYDLEIKVRNIEDNPGNTTRFLVLSTEMVGRSGRDKTSLVMSNTNQPGALYQQLAPLADAGISMTRIESRPMRAGLWEYVFFVDVEGHIEDSKVEAAVEAIKKESAFFKVLGSYPRGL